MSQPALAAVTPRVDPEVAEAVRLGLTAAHRTLPPWLLYDAAGVELYERITALPEYYLTRAEAELFARHADALLAATGGRGRMALAELGAGTATKTEVLLEAALRRQQGCTFLACDVAPSALEVARHRLAQRLPDVQLRCVVGPHGDAIEALARLGRTSRERQVALFLGNSIGNYTDAAAVELLAGVRGALRPDGALILGTDLRKSPAQLVPAYDDAQGVTAAFNRNLLVRINRELGADFRSERFLHRAEWNPDASDMELFLESACDQRVRIDALGLVLTFRRGERIHTESSAKYDLPRVDRILEAAGLVRVRTFHDRRERVAVHVARPVTENSPPGSHSR